MVTRRWLCLLLVGATALVAGAARPVAHPLHTTLTELKAGTDGAVQVQMRVFADDYGRAVATARGTTPNERERVYVGSAFVLRERNGRAVRFTWCGTRYQGEVVWVCLRGAAASGVRGGQVRNAMLFDLYQDQVNVVRAQYAGRARSLLFTPGDGARRLP